MTALGTRQQDVLAAAVAGTCTVRHSAQGRMTIHGLRDSYGDDVIDSLLRRKLIDLVEDDRVINGFTVTITGSACEALIGYQIGSDDHRASVGGPQIECSCGDWRGAVNSVHPWIAQRLRQYELFGTHLRKFI
jgi:hypothetical protein